MKVYAVIDTNVLVSALLAKRPDSAPVQILDRLFSRDFIPRDDSYLVTGNIKHFPAVKKVVTPNELLDILKSLDDE